MPTLAVSTFSFGPTCTARQGIEFAVEHGLIEPEETAPQRRAEWGQPGRIMSVYSNMVRER